MATRRGKRETSLEHLAEAIADGRAIDWNAASAGAPAERFEELQVIQGIANAYRVEHDAFPTDPVRKPSAGTNGDRRNGQASPEPQRTESAGSRSAVPPSNPLFTWKHLLVLERIGKGTFSEVYRAYDPTLECEVALKLRRADAPQDERAVERFLEEACKLARIRHPNVLKVHGADVHDGRVGIWTDLVRGKTLEEVVQQEGAYSTDMAIVIGMDLCCALASLHANGLVHRDIKPANIMCEHGGHIWLMDLGSAGELRMLPPLRQGAFDGTPVTMAPEVLLRGETPTAAADIYSLGAVLYYLVSRRYPVEAASFSELVNKHKCGDSRPLLEVRPDVPRGFAQVLEHALAREPEQRYTGTGVMHRALCELLVQRGNTPRHSRLRQWLRERRQKLALASVAAAVLLAGSMFAAWWWAPLHVEASLNRVRGGTTEPLTNGGSVRAGDEAYLDIRGSQAMRVWVVNEDGNGGAYKLFPLDEEPAPKLAAGQTYRLPYLGEGQSNWVFDAEGPTETILVIASRRKLGNLEAELAGIRERGAPSVRPIPRGSEFVTRLMGRFQKDRVTWMSRIVLTKEQSR